MKKTYKSVEGAPSAIGPYSVAATIGDLLFTSGQLPIDVNTGEISGSTAAEQAKYALDNIKKIVEELGSSIDNVIKVNIFVTDMGSFAEVNEVYGQYFKENCPTRSCVEVSKLPKSALIEIDAIAVINK